MPEAVGTSGVAVQGLRELQYAFSKAGKEANMLMKTGLREIAEPIRSDAERLAVSGIPRIGPKWSRMRTGVTRKLIYVAPKQRGVKSPHDPKNRPKFGVLLAERAMTPALERNEGRIVPDLERLFGRLAADFNRRS